MPENTYGADHVVRMVPSRYPEHHDMWNSDDAVLLRTHSRYVAGRVRFSVMFQGPLGECRRVQDGPIVPGPYAPLIAQGSVLSSHPDPNPPRIIDVKAGETVALRCVVGQITERVFVGTVTDDDRMDYPHLTGLHEVTGIGNGGWRVWAEMEPRELRAVSRLFGSEAAAERWASRLMAHDTEIDFEAVE